MKYPSLYGGALVALIPLVSTADENKPDDIHHANAMEHVIVTMPLHKAPEETAFTIDYLSGAELAREASATLGDTLANTPGVHNASFGPGVGQPVVRGLQGPRVLSLVNSTRSADVSALSPDHVVAVEPLLADAIEVLRGPGSLLYGGGAIGGVVNVIDGRVPYRRLEESEFKMEYRYDGATNGNVGVGRADIVLGNLILHADGIYRATDDLAVPDGIGTEDGDVLENTDTDADAWTLGGAFHFDGGFFGLSAQGQANNYGLPAGTHDHHHDDEDHDEHEGEDHDEDHEGEDHDEDHDHEHEGEEEEGGIRLDMEQTRYDAVVHLDNPFAGIEEIWAFGSYTEYEHAEIEPSGEIGTLFENEAWQGRLEVMHGEVLGLGGVVGLQFNNSEFSAEGEEAYVVPTDIEQFGVFILEDIALGDLTLEAGLRYDRDEFDPALGRGPDTGFDAINASLGAIWAPGGGNWSLSSSITSAERAPDVAELYANAGNSPDEWVEHAATGAIELGNTELDTEQSLNVDVGFNWRHEGHRLSASVFVHDFSNYINLATIGEVGETPVRAYEEDEAFFYGAEIDAEWRLMALESGELTLQTGADFVRGELDAGGDVPRLPPARLILGLGQYTDDFDLYTRVVFAAEQDRPGINEEATDSYTRWDIGLDWRLPAAGSDITLHAGVRNILDEEIRLSTSFLREEAPEPGRSLQVGVRWEL